MIQTISMPQTGILDFPFYVEKRSLESGYSEHFHDYIEINVIVRGSAVQSVNGKPQPIKTGDVFVLNPGTSHGFSRTEHLMMYQAMYNPVLLEPCLPALKKMPGYHALFIIEPAKLLSANPFRSFTTLSMKELKAVVMLFENMILEFNERREGFQAILHADLMRMVTILSRQYLGDKADNPGVIRRIARTAAFMEENYLYRLSLQRLAEVADCSACQLIRDFKQNYGATPFEYILHLRIEHAILLLRNSALGVTDIAFSCGFADSNYFSRAFKKHTGLTPSQFRNMN